MKALLCYNQNEFKLKEIDKPEIQKDEMLIEMIYTGLCGSDIIKILDSDAKKPAVYGHEVVGRVVEVGKITFMFIRCKLSEAEYRSLTLIYFLFNKIFMISKKNRSGTIISISF
ncbi:unnamed protein product [marine sediment metagenome]|uniref:Alcohol dehydrogenase-like N-terminal domain-containing protein n=1 Tax=marine sediment metagenome TaxID=412755 RepID=X1IMN0_9ZZZZ